MDISTILLPKGVPRYLNIEIWNQTNPSIYFSELFAFQNSEIILNIHALQLGNATCRNLFQGNNSKEQQKWKTS